MQFKVFEQLLELQLAKIALHLHLASECPCESVGSFAERGALLHVYLYSLVEPCESLVLLLFRFVEGFTHCLQALLKRVDYLRHLFAVALAQLVLAAFQNFLRSGLYLFFYQLQLTVNLLAVHQLQGFYLLFVALLCLVQLLLVRRFQLGNLCFIGQAHVLYGIRVAFCLSAAILFGFVLLFLLVSRSLLPQFVNLPVVGLLHLGDTLCGIGFQRFELIAKVVGNVFLHVAFGSKSRNLFYISVYLSCLLLVFAAKFGHTRLQTVCHRGFLGIAMPPFSADIKSQKQSGCKHRNQNNVCCHNCSFLLFYTITRRQHGTFASHCRAATIIQM